MNEHAKIWPVPCATCGAGIGYPCTGSKYTHTVRIVAINARSEARAAEVSSLLRQPRLPGFSNEVDTR